MIAMEVNNLKFCSLIFPFVRTARILAAPLFLASCNPNAMSRQMTIAWSNNAVSWPVFAVLSRDTHNSGILFYDFEKNIVVSDFSSSNSVNSVSSYGEESGNFLFTATEGFGNYVLYHYDYYSKLRRIIFEYEHILVAPFRVSDSFCALSPKSKTSKQNYNYDIICNGEVSVTDIFPVYSYYNHDVDSAIFVDGVGIKKNAYSIYKANGILKYKKHEIPFFSNIFSVVSNESGLVMVDRGNHEIQKYVVTDESIVSIGYYENLGGMCHEISNYNTIIMLNNERIIGNRINDEKNGFEFLICELNKDQKSYQASMKIE